MYVSTRKWEGGKLTSEHVAYVYPVLDINYPTRSAGKTVMVSEHEDKSNSKNEGVLNV